MFHVDGKPAPDPRQRGKTQLFRLRAMSPVSGVPNRDAPDRERGPRGVAVVIPAKDEHRRIAATVRAARHAGGS